MIRLLENAILGHRVLNFIFLNDDFLLQDLDGKKLSSCLLATENDFAKCSLAEHFQELEVLQSLRGRNKTQFMNTSEKLR